MRYSAREETLNLLPALRREEKRLEQAVGKVQNELNAVKKAIEAFGKTYRNGTRRKMSAEARARIAKAQKARWAKVRAAKSKS